MSNPTELDVKKKIVIAIERFEYRISGKYRLNGGFAEFELKDLETISDYYKATGTITLGDCFGNPKKEVYPGCFYYVDNKDFHILNKKELVKMGVEL